MANFNKVILMGHLTRDPNLSQLPTGTPVCDIGLAVNRRWRDASGQQRDEVLFVDCTAFARTGQNIATHFKKGQAIHLEGHLKLDRWETQEGAARSKIRVVIEGFRFVESAKAQNGNGQNRPEGETPQPPKRPARGKRRTESATEPTPAVNTEDIPF